MAVSQTDTWPLNGSIRPTRRHAPPMAPERLLRRDRVLRSLDLAADARVICLRAPAGYGKTTALLHWVARDPRPTMWLTVRPEATDAQWLAQALIDALAESGLVTDAVALNGSLSMASWHLDTLPLIEDRVSRVSQPFLVVVDDAGALAGAPWESLVESVASALPAGAQLVLTTRDRVPAALWRLQSRGQVRLIGPEVLAFDESETTRVMQSLQLSVSPEQLHALSSSTGGWPVAVYLAGLSMRSSPGASVSTTLVGNSGLRQYLLQEVVGRLADEDAAFLCRVSVLSQLDGQACDEVAGTTHSLQRLRRLASDDHLLSPQDEPAETFTMHPLLAELLSGWLQESDPDQWRNVQAAASRAMEDRGDLDGAVHHAKLAADDQRLAELIWPRAAFLLGSGQFAVLQRWLEAVDEQRLTRWCGLALSAAWVASHEGGIPRMSRLALAASETAALNEPACVLDTELLAATIGAQGLGQVEAAAGAFVSGKRGDDPWQTVAHFLLGVALLMRDESDQAMPALGEGYRLAVALDIPVMAAHCLAVMADVALEEGDERRALSWIRESREIAVRHRIDAITTTAPIFITSAVGYVREGRFADARGEAARALALTSRMHAVAPWHAVQGRLMLAQVNIAVGDSERARMLLDEASDARGPATASVRLDRLYAQTCERLTMVTKGLAGASSLTTAEVRVLQYLPSHLSFPAIADELLVSRHTVKTQALSAYRKLGVHSRSEAIIRARKAGLLPPG